MGAAVAPLLNPYVLIFVKNVLGNKLPTTFDNFEASEDDFSRTFPGFSEMVKFRYLDMFINAPGTLWNPSKSYSVKLLTTFKELGVV